MSFFSDLWTFLKIRKKLWLLPIIIFAVLLGVLIVVAETSGVLAPFIYTLF